MTNDRTSSNTDDQPPEGNDLPVDIWDSTGFLVGRFYKTGLPYRPEGYILDGKWPSDEEIERRLQEEPSYSVLEADQFFEELKRAVAEGRTPPFRPHRPQTTHPA